MVDLWGGYRDLERRLPWQKDTLVLVYSSTKGLAGMMMTVAHSRGLLDFDEPVTTYWPEFAQGGKESIAVRQLLSHQAGLSGLDKSLDLKTIADRGARQTEACVGAGDEIRLPWHQPWLVSRRTHPLRRSSASEPGPILSRRDSGAARYRVLHRPSARRPRLADSRDQGLPTCADAAAHEHDAGRDGPCTDEPTLAH